MRASIHVALTLVLTVVSTLVAIFFTLVVCFHWDRFAAMHAWPRWWAVAVWVLPFVGLEISGLLMSWIPCVCPRCGGKAHLETNGIFMNFTPVRGIGGHWAWSCEDCHWSTRRWSTLYKRQAA